jgi:hypothetical protein
MMGNLFVYNAPSSCLKRCNQLWVTDDVSVLGKINKLQKKTDDVLDIIY